MDASNLLKPALASRQRCAASAATTYKEYRQYFEKDRALVRRFQKIDVAEPTHRGFTIKILKGHQVVFRELPQDPLHRRRHQSGAVELSAKYINDRKLPDKAIDVIDELGASQHAAAGKPAPQERWRCVKDVEDDGRQDRAHSVQVRQQADDTEALRRRWSADLKSRRLWARCKAIHALSSAIKLARAGLRQPEKPIGNPICSAAPPAWARPKLRKQLAATHGRWNSCAST